MKKSSLQYHQVLAEYFDSKEYFLESIEEQRARARLKVPTSRPVNTRKVTELPTQFLHTQHLEKIGDLFTDLSFLEAKTEDGKIFDLISDYSQAINFLPSNSPKYITICLLKEALKRDISFIEQNPTLLFQSLWNLCWWYDCSEASSHYEFFQNDWSVHQPPWDDENTKISKHFEIWHAEKLSKLGSFKWLRSLRPPTMPLRNTLIDTYSLSKTELGNKDIGSFYYILDSKDGKIISAFSSNSIISWDRYSGKMLRENSYYHWTYPIFTNHLKIIQRNDQSITDYYNNHLAVIDNKDILILDCNSQETLFRLQGNLERVNLLEFSPNGSLLASVSSDGYLRIWDPTKNSKLTEWTVADIKEEVLTFGRRITPNAWGEELKSILIDNSSTVSALRFSFDGNSIAIGTYEGEIFIFDINKSRQEKFQLHQGSIKSIAFSNNGDLIAIGTSYGSISVWKISHNYTGSAYNHIERGFKYFAIERGEEIRALHFCKDDLNLLSVNSDNVVQLWGIDQITGAKLKRRGFDDEIKWHEFSISPNGKLLALSTGNDKASVFSIPHGKLISSITLEADRGTGDIERLEFSEDSGQIAAIGDNDPLRNEYLRIGIYDVETGNCLKIGGAHRDPVYGSSQIKVFKNMPDSMIYDESIPEVVGCDTFDESAVLNSSIIVGKDQLGYISIYRLEGV